MSGLLELAERCETAPQSDRHLDAEIACLIGKPEGNIEHWLHGADIRYRPTAYGYYVAVLPDGGTSSAYAAGEFTASLDAAITLVPEGWTIDEYHESPSSRVHFCELQTVERIVYGFKGVKARANTGPLALCAAALRALHTARGEG